MTRNLLRTVVCLVLLPGLLSLTAFAGNKNRIGTAGAQELLIPVGARGVAIGASSSVFLKGAEAIYWNPAGLSRMTNSVDAMFSQMTYIADINVTYGAIGVKAGEFGDLGFSIKSLSFGDIPVTTVDYPDGTGEQYSPTFLTLGVTYSKLLTDRISVGGTAYLVSEKILNMSASGLVFDVGIQYHNLGIQGLMLGVAVKSIGPNMTFEGSNAYVSATTVGSNRGQQPYIDQMAAFEVPATMELGVAYSPVLDEKNQLTVGGMFRNNNYSDDEYGLGTEYSYKQLFFVRGGYGFSPQTDKDLTDARGYIYDWTLGAGVHYDVGGIGVKVDYAYRNVKYFDANHTITIGLAF
ncbi:MAG: PorV/PorQ family protein [Bacteroidota bacterium]